MLLVCDRTVSERGNALREEILRSGYPCAFCTPSEISNYLPLLRIITFIDVFDDVRRTPYDNIRVLVIGRGFVNSALNADQTEVENNAFLMLEDAVYDFFNVKPDWCYPAGVFYDDGVFMGKRFFMVFCNMIVPTKREYLIYKYLQMACRVCDYIPAERICRFCYPTSKIPKDENEAAKNLAVHVTNLNKKSQNVMGCHIIEAKRFVGYRIKKDI